MPTVIVRSVMPLPVTYESWAAWRGEKGAPDTSDSGGVSEGGFCGTCWGQGSIHSPAANGEGLVPLPCRWCGGSGRVNVRR